MCRHERERPTLPHDLVRRRRRRRGDHRPDPVAAYPALGAPGFAGRLLPRHQHHAGARRAADRYRPNRYFRLGDDVQGDVEGALDNGLQACLVQTGKYQAGDDKRIDGVVDLKVYFHNGIYKYTSGQFKSISEAKNQLSKLKELGYGDAFIVPFDGDERIGFEQARQMERGN